MNTITGVARQFFGYLLSGGTAAIADFGIYYLLLELGIWYMTANIAGGVFGFFVTFFLNKYAVFHKKDHFTRHIFRFFIIDMLNIAVLAVFLYALVDILGIDPHYSKILVYIPVILWNFLMYKFIVYT